MSERPSPEDAAESVRTQVDELERILFDLVQSNDPVMGQHRFDRWKSRTASLVLELLGTEEANRFEKTYVPLIMGGGELQGLLDEIHRHEAALKALVEEIQAHPEILLAETGRTDDPSVKTGVSTVEAADDEFLTATESPSDPRKVFVIHGRDEEARRALFSFLQDLDLHPIQWEELVQQTGKGSPYNGEVVARAFREARAVVVLMTPDDEVRLHRDLHGKDEPPHETELTGQARPNVFLEAGMALQAQPERTIFVQIGNLRAASDLAGLNSVRMGVGPGPLLAIATRLETAGCAVNKSSEAWMDLERFTGLSAHDRRPVPAPRAGTHGLPRGTRLQAEAPQAAPPQLFAELHSRGRDYLLEVVNRGGVTLKNVRWELPGGVNNWFVLTDVLPDYPILELPPRGHVRVPVSIAGGGPVIVDLRLHATTEDDQLYETEARLSIYG